MPPPPSPRKIHTHRQKSVVLKIIENHPVRGSSVTAHFTVEYSISPCEANEKLALPITVQSSVIFQKPESMFIDPFLLLIWLSPCLIVVSFPKYKRFSYTLKSRSCLASVNLPGNTCEIWMWSKRCQKSTMSKLSSYGRILHGSLMHVNQSKVTCTWTHVINKDITAKRMSRCVIKQSGHVENIFIINYW